MDHININILIFLKSVFHHNFNFFYMIFVTANRKNYEFHDLHKFNTSDTTTKKQNHKTIIFFQTLNRNIKT